MGIRWISLLRRPAQVSVDPVEENFEVKKKGKRKTENRKREISKQEERTELYAKKNLKN